MDIMKIEQTAYILDSEEKKKLVKCLEYCQYRLGLGAITGIDGQGIKPGFLKYMISNFKETGERKLKSTPAIPITGFHLFKDDGAVTLYGSESQEIWEII